LFIFFLRAASSSSSFLAFSSASFCLSSQSFFSFLSSSSSGVRPGLGLSLVVFGGTVGTGSTGFSTGFSGSLTAGASAGFSGSGAGVGAAGAGAAAVALADGLVVLAATVPLLSSVSFSGFSSSLVLFSGLVTFSFLTSAFFGAAGFSSLSQYDLTLSCSSLTSFLVLWTKARSVK